MKTKFGQIELFNIELSGIDTKDYPDFCDAYVAHAEFGDGTEISEELYEEINNDSGFVYELVIDYLF